MPARTIQGVHLALTERNETRIVIELDRGDVIHAGEGIATGSGMLWAIACAIGPNLSGWPGQTIYIDVTPDFTPDTPTDDPTEDMTAF